MASGGSGLPVQQCPFLEPRDEGPQCLAMGIPRRIPTAQRARFCYTANHDQCPRYRFGGARRPAEAAATKTPDGDEPAVDETPVGDAAASDTPATGDSAHADEQAATAEVPEPDADADPPPIVPRRAPSKTTVAQPALRPIQARQRTARTGRRAVRRPPPPQVVTRRRVVLVSAATLVLIVVGAIGILANLDRGGNAAPALTPTQGIAAASTPTQSVQPTQTVAAAPTTTATAEAQPTPVPATPIPAPTVTPVPTEPAVATGTPPLTAPAAAKAAPSPVPAAPAPVVPGTYVVAPGDTLDAIASRFGTRPDLIAAASGLTDPAWIVPGQQLFIPDAEGFLPDEAPFAGVWRVVSGDTLDALARRYGASVDEMVVANRLVDRRYIEVGWVLVAPRPGTVQIPPPVSAPVVVFPSPADIDGEEYTVVEGDTVYSLARRFGVTVDAILEANGLPSAYIQAGWTLLIPAT